MIKPIYKYKKEWLKVLDNTSRTISKNDRYRQIEHRLDQLKNNLKDSLHIKNDTNEIKAIIQIIKGE